MSVLNGWMSLPSVVLEWVKKQELEAEESEGSATKGCFIRQSE